MLKKLTLMWQEELIEEGKIKAIRKKFPSLSQYLEHLLIQDNPELKNLKRVVKEPER